MKIEHRSLETEVRMEGEGEAPKLTGYAARFGELSQRLGGKYGFKEKIDRGAFAKSIARGDDVRALWSHNPEQILGRTKSGTLRIREDERGLFIEIDPPDTQVGRDATTLIKRGDVTQMSFGFRVIGEKWETVGGEEIRTLTEVDLIEVSPVAFPAYTATEINARSIDEIAERRNAERQAEQEQETTISVEQRRMRLRLLEMGL